MDLRKPFFETIAYFYEPISALPTFFFIVIEHYLVWHPSFRKERLKVLYRLGLVIVFFDAVLLAKTQFVIRGLPHLPTLSLPPAMLAHKHDYLVVGGI
jgi:hypothetical protein